MAETVRQANRRRRYGWGAWLPPPSLPRGSLVRALVTLAHEVSSSEKPIVCQRINVAVMIRRVKLLSMLFEEVKDLGISLPPSAVRSFEDLHKILHGIKLLIDDCRERSSIWSLMQHEQLSMLFHELAQKMADALDVLPTKLLDISDEVREQVDLVHRQARKAKLYIDTKEEQLRLDVLSAMARLGMKEAPDGAMLKWIFQRLQINNTRDCQTELHLLEDEFEIPVEGQRPLDVSIADLMGFIRYCKCVLYGVADTEEIESSVVQGSSNNRDSTVELEEQETAGLSIPDEYKCPISLDLMKDPVIVATGQTYDRPSITRWVEGGHLTCPKSGMKLLHTNLIPNYALRSLIIQWCQDNNVRFDIPEGGSKSTSVIESMVATPLALEATRMTAAFLVNKLSTADSPDVQRQVVYELRLLAKCGMDNRMCIAEAGAIPLLVPLLSSDDSRTQEHAVTTLLNLSIYEPNKALIMGADALDPVVDVLRFGGSLEARENAAATLFSLSGITEYKVVIGNKPEAISGLVHLLSDSSPRGKRDATTAIFNLALHHPNRAKIVKARAVPVLVESLASDRPNVADNALAVLAVLAKSAEGLVAISGASAIPTLVNILMVGSAKGKENSISVLLALCRYGDDSIVDSVRNIQSILSTLHSIVSMGSSRAKRNAAALLRILLRWDQSHVEHHPQ